MGQALRRTAGRITTSSKLDTASSQNLGKPPPRVLPVEKPPIDDVTPSPEDGASRVNMENVLEDRDPKYDVLLNKMVGRIQSKPGGKPEMGDASVVDKYKRPLPKLRNTTADSSRYEERPAPPGTLNVAQVRQIILLHQGKSDEHDGPMDVPQIAARFRIDSTQVQNILQFVALPPQDDNKKNNQE